MKLANIKIIILLIALLSISCASKHEVKQVPVKTEITYVEKLVPVELPADSSAVIALFKCDSTNNVILQQLEESKSKRVVTNYSLRDGRFIYKTITIRDTVFLPSKELVITEQKPVIIEKTTIENKLKLWQKILIWFGVGFIVYIISRIVKIIKNIW